ncbi:MAG: hypothetical protein ABFD69_13220 [Candidatus Sumerlaeia bacterium]
MNNSKADQVYYRWNLRDDYSKKAGVNGAVLMLDETPETRAEEREVEKLKGGVWARVIVDGPLWDCLRALSDLIVSERLMIFLKACAGDDLDFVPVELRWDEKRKETGYHAVIFKKFVSAQQGLRKFDLNAISKSGHAAMIVGNEKGGDFRSFFMRADLAEELIAAGFTGLGFDNFYSDAKPGCMDGRERVYPEAGGAGAETPEKPGNTYRKLLEAAKTIEDGWQALLAAAKKKQKSRAWDALAELDVKKDLKSHVDWLVKGFKEEPPPKEINALWFGIFERLEQKTKSSYATLYIAGSDRYDAEKRYSIDWAVRPRYFPEWRYAPSPVLDQISSEEHKAKGSHDAFTFLTLGYAALLTRFALVAAMKTIEHDFGEQQCPVAVGFDEGGFFFIGSVSNEGFKEEK